MVATDRKYITKGIKAMEEKLNKYLQSAPERMDVKDVATMQNLSRKRIVELESFIKRFCDNFKPCGYCDNGCDENGDACNSCGGTGDELESRGVLLSELLPDARVLYIKGEL
jgi:hypothetical protein